MIRRARLLQELARLDAASCEGIAVVRSQEDAVQVAVDGPADSYYAGMQFGVRVVFGERYPFEPPSVVFDRPAPYHPNIDAQGNVCLDLLRAPPSGAWRPNVGVEALLVALRVLLVEANPDDPLDAQAAYEWRHDRAAFAKKARQGAQADCDSELVMLRRITDLMT